LGHIEEPVLLFQRLNVRASRQFHFLCFIPLLDLFHSTVPTE